MTCRAGGTRRDRGHQPGPVSSELSVLRGRQPDRRGFTRPRAGSSTPLSRRADVSRRDRRVSYEDVRHGYRWMAFSGLLVAIGAPMVVAQTERGDEMFMTMLARHCQQTLDTDALTLLGAAHRIRPAGRPGRRGPPSTERGQVLEREPLPRRDQRRREARRVRPRRGRAEPQRDRLHRVRGRRGPPVDRDPRL